MLARTCVQLSQQEFARKVSLHFFIFIPVEATIREAPKAIGSMDWRYSCRSVPLRQFLIVGSKSLTV
jgi:hypothetical protein